MRLFTRASADVKDRGCANTGHITDEWGWHWNYVLAMCCQPVLGESNQASDLRPLYCSQLQIPAEKWSETACSVRVTANTD